MKKVININFQGVIIPIEESAYEILKNYISDLQKYFAREEGKDEIINDIEGRIGELFQNRIKEGATCITDEDVNRIIDNMGRIHDLEEADSDNAGRGSEEQEEEQGSSSYSGGQQRPRQLYRNEKDKILGGVCSGIALYLGVDPWLVRILFIISGIGLLAYIILWIFLPGKMQEDTPSRRRLYRNPDDKIIGGVCGGIGSYFDINPWLPRILFLLPFISFFFRWHYWEVWTFPHFFRFTFSPGIFLLYVILWLIIPEAKTRSEKMQMKGEKVDLNSIKDSVTKEITEAAKRVGKLGKDAENFIRTKSTEAGDNLKGSSNQVVGQIGRIIATLIKIFVYIIVGSIVFALLIALLAIAAVCIGIFPLKDFIIPGGWQNILAWITLLCLVILPVIGIITFIIRKLTKRTSGNGYIRGVGISLWIVGWICLFALGYSLRKEFKYISTENEEVVNLTNPKVDYLEVMPAKASNYRWRSWLSFEPYSYLNIDDDTALISNVRIRIFKSENDQMSVRYVKMSNGKSQEKANDLAAKIRFSASQQDSVLYMNNYIPINTNDKFRNQFVEVAIFIPVNHRFKIDNNYSSSRHANLYFLREPEDFYFRNDSQYAGYPFSFGEEYMMEESGPRKISGRDEDRDGNDSQGNAYRYQGNFKIDSLKKEQERQLKKMDESIDSVRKEHERTIQKMQDSLIRQRDEINRKLRNLES